MLGGYICYCVYVSNCCDTLMYRTNIRNEVTVGIAYICLPDPFAKVSYFGTKAIVIVENLFFVVFLHVFCITKAREHDHYQVVVVVSKIKSI